jgi:F-type H+-transporting ATPase subunit delta
MADPNVDHRIEAYARALLEVARAEGMLGEVEDDLFRFARVFEGTDDLRMALTDPSLPADRRMAVVEELMGGKALNVSAALASFVVGIGRAAELPAIVGRFVELAAAEREHAVAEVRSAVPLDESQQQRLAEALSKATGKRVEVKVIIDEKVLGGIVARVGDTVIDGTIRHRLEQLKETI